MGEFHAPASADSLPPAAADVMAPPAGESLQRPSDDALRDAASAQVPSKVGGGGLLGPASDGSEIGLPDTMYPCMRQALGMRMATSRVHIGRRVTICR